MVYADPAEPDAYQKAGRRLRDLRMRPRQPVDIPSSSSDVTPAERDFAKADCDFRSASAGSRESEERWWTRTPAPDTRIGTIAGPGAGRSER